jgi:hypothetical protein
MKIVPEPKMVKLYQCGHCGRISESGQSFFFVYGNVMIGESGGLIGNNLSEDGENRVENVSVFCYKCMFDTLFDAIKSSKGEITVLEKDDLTAMEEARKAVERITEERKSG